uniref:7TM_GPCR_Srx domain-containing protein n=1 Tax=Heterorhabditis bacteriophora TaxID=37862 RepID=A0A1I7WU82_HETBA
MNLNKTQILRKYSSINNNIKPKRLIIIVNLMTSTILSRMRTKSITRYILCENRKVKYADPLKKLHIRMKLVIFILSLTVRTIHHFAGSTIFPILACTSWIFFNVLSYFVVIVLLGFKKIFNIFTIIVLCMPNLQYRAYKFNIFPEISFCHSFRSESHSLYSYLRQVSFPMPDNSLHYRLLINIIYPFSVLVEITHWKMAKKGINNYWLNRKRMLNLENDSLERPSLPKRRYVEPEDEELGNQSEEYAFD